MIRRPSLGSPPTILGQATTRNGLQSNSGAWTAVTDSGSGTAQGFKFVVEGSMLPVELQKFDTR